MTYVVIVTEALLYVCLGIVSGVMFLYIMPKVKTPSIVIRQSSLVLCTAGILIFSFAPVLNTLITFTADLGFWTAFKSVMLTFTVGQAWLFTAIIALLLMGLIHFNDLASDRFLATIGFILVILLIASYAKAGHAASLAPIKGFWFHYLHLLAVMLWGGTAVVAAFRSQSTQRWLPFLHWYTPFAVGAFILLLLAGLGTMFIDIADPLDGSIKQGLIQYKQGLASNYGQALLIKNILVIPLVIFAAFNSLFVKHQLRHGKSIDPLKWLRAEAVIIVVIFAVTAFMGQQKPPHEMASLIELNGPSPLFSALFPNPIAPGMTLTFDWTTVSVLFLILGLILISLTAITLLKKASKNMALLLSFAAAISWYFTVMTSIHS
ncbi:copper resistance D family protein [Tuberibacillus sp. Marseille-P3662]|uniref:copper resistance D family protein n=1 Tax=Tuberibacillus sp. Marseille-P3662 TaxID=1965358 RepID=UPI000A1CBE4A|nr:CopD family protein [Tuberibacillus sp. Marseille-P3662]